MYQGRNYSVALSATNTASSTLPLVGISSTAAIRPAIYEFVFGSSGAPANQACSFLFQRATTVGAGTAFTPVALDPGDPASTATSNITYTTGPTLTANAHLYRFGLNQQATFRWIAAPGSEMKAPATANNGIMCLNIATSTTWTAEGTLYFAE